MGADKDPTLINVPRDKRVESVKKELYCRGTCYVAADVCRKDIMIIAQKVANLVVAIEDTCGEAPTKSCLYDSASNSLRRGRHGSFRVSRMTSRDLPEWLDHERERYNRVVIATHSPQCWQLQPVG